MATVTAGDYTVDIQITEAQYRHFMEDCRHQLYSDETPGYGLKFHLKAEIEEKLTTEIPPQGFDEVDRIRVADIQLAYHNGEILRILRQRGDMIKKGKWKAVKKLTEKLDEAKTKHLQTLVQPVAAFITFESEEGYQRALKADEIGVTILGKQAKVTQAPEPTNIIWENREVSNIQKLLRSLVVLGILVLICVITFSGIVLLMRYNNYAFEKYQDQDCQEIEQVYTPLVLKDYAILDWFNYYNKETDDPHRKLISSELKCFCEK